MGLTYCKSLFTRNKTQTSVNLDNGTAFNKPQPAAVTANDFGLSTLQSAVESQGVNNYATVAFHYRNLST